MGFINLRDCSDEILDYALRNIQERLTYDPDIEFAVTPCGETMSGHDCIKVIRAEVERRKGSQ